MESTSGTKSPEVGASVSKEPGWRSGSALHTKRQGWWALRTEHSGKLHSALMNIKITWGESLKNTNA